MAWGNEPKPKKIKFIDSTIFYNSDENNDSGGVPWVNFAPNKEIDLLRFRMGTCWNKEGRPKLTQQIGLNLEMLPGSRKRPIPVPPVDIDPNKKLKREKIVINWLQDKVIKQEGVTDKLSDVQRWVSFIDQDESNPGQMSHGIVSTFSKLRDKDGETPKWFYDHVCEIEVPTSKKELSEGSFLGSLRVMEASVDPVYNFYIQNYEDGVWKYEPDEKILPNFYSFLTVLQSEDINPEELDTIFEKQVNLGGAISGPSTNYFTEVKQVLSNKGQKTQKITKTSKGQYFDKYAYSLHKLNTSPYEENCGYVQKRFQNLIAPITNMELFTNYNNIAQRFPMYYDISFSTDISTELAGILKDARLSSVLLKDLAADKISPKKFNFNFYPTENVPFVPTPTTPVTYDSDSNPENVKLEYINPTALNAWDMNEWFNKVASEKAGIYDMNLKGDSADPIVFLGKYNEEIKAAENDSFDFFKNLMVLIFAAKFGKMVNEKTRTFADIMMNKLAYHETVLYRIEKWATSPGGAGVTPAPDTGGPIQTFYLPNSDEIDVHKFIDTQVIYGKSYTYRIYAYEMVFGTAYKYTLDALPPNSTAANDQNLSQGSGRICVFTKPSLKLIEVPYFQTVSKMIDAPPVWPDVDIIPQRGIKDKLLFFFRGNVGEYKLKPIPFQPDDQEKIDRIREGQKHIVGLNGLIQYRSDDQARIFEVFRTDKKPTSYEDFRNTKRAHITTDNFDTPCKAATGGSFMDTLKPNTKYYYTFRTVDVHGHFSNPTPVYEVEIVYDAGAPFLLTRIITDGHDFKKEKSPPQIISKKVKKYIQIKPAEAQTSIDYQETMVGDISGKQVPLHDDMGMPSSNLPSLKNINFTNKVIKMGLENEKVWGKKFKIRVISKKTGRRIDFNIGFEHDHLENAQKDSTNILCEK